METADGVYLRDAFEDRVLCICNRGFDWELRRPIRQDGVWLLRSLGALSIAQAAELLGMSSGYAGQVLAKWTRKQMAQGQRYRAVRFTTYSARQLLRKERVDRDIEWQNIHYPHSTTVWMLTLKHLAPIRDSLRGLYEC